MGKTRWTEARLRAVLWVIDEWMQMRTDQGQPLSTIAGGVAQLGLARQRLMEELADRKPRKK